MKAIKFNSCIQVSSLLQASFNELKLKKPPMDELCRNVEKGYAEKESECSDGML